MRAVLLHLLFFASALLNAQAGLRVEVMHADEWMFDNTLAPGAQRLRGKVSFRHADAVMYCDSAWLYRDQRVLAFGRVRIQQGDTLTVTGDRLEYTGADRRAMLEGGVVLRDPSSELYTESLIYDLQGRSAWYDQGGTIIGLTGGDTLRSREGTYLTDARTFVFQRDVVLRHPERTITGDTLHYRTATGLALFFGPTLITQGNTRIHCVRGWYDTRSGRAEFTRRARVTGDGREIEGDSLHYDGRTREGRAWGAVVARDTANGTEVQGAVGRFVDQGREAMVTGRARMLLRMDDDTLHLHADTLFVLPDSLPDQRRIVARRGVRFHKRDLQGVCDTLVHREADSTLRMFHAPVLWSGKDQITARHIRIKLVDGRVDRLLAEEEAFMISRVDSLRFDQVSGRRMTGYFRDNVLDHLLTEGNCRTIYFAQEERDGGREVVGMNMAECARMRVDITDDQVASVTFITKPEAVLHPIGQVTAAMEQLEGFAWRDAERPVDRDDIFRRPIKQVP